MLGRLYLAVGMSVPKSSPPAELEVDWPIVASCITGGLLVVVIVAIVLLVRRQRRSATAQPDVHERPACCRRRRQGSSRGLGHTPLVT